MLPFINIHYLTLYADGNMVIQDYLNMSGIYTLDFILPFTCAAAGLHKTYDASLQNEVDTLFYQLKKGTIRKWAIKKNVQNIKSNVITSI